MITFSEGQLLNELKKKFRDNKRALYDLRIMTKKLGRLNKKLQDSEALKSNFLSNIRNEMNDPLASIVGLSGQLLSHPAMDKRKIQTVAEMIYSEAFNLEFQLKNIFAAAEIEAGETSLDISNVDICTLVRSTIESFRYRTAEKGVAVRFDCKCPDKRCLFKTDPAKLDLVISNLLSNAVGFSFKGGDVVVRAVFHNRSLSISVRDFGVGIEKASQAVIFDRFKQLDSSSTRSHKGHGIGLSVVKSIIEILDGSISVSSEKKKGSTFKITLPEREFASDAFSSAKNEFIYEEKEF